MIIPVDKNGKILLQKEYSYPINDFLFQFPGGLVEDHESPKDGGLRELMEEAKLTGDLRQIGWMYTNNRRSQNKCFSLWQQTLIFQVLILILKKHLKIIG